MEITRENYECFFLDYIEGNLEPEMAQVLSDFLKKNPDLSEELDTLLHTENTFFKTSAETEHFQDKEKLKKPLPPISKEELEGLFIREMENDLTPSEAQLLHELYITYPFIASTGRLYAKTKLAAPEMSFENKSSIRIDSEIDLSDRSMLLAAAAEGDLKKEEALSFFDRLAQDPIQKKEFETLSRIKLNPQNDVFDFKETISHPEKIDLDNIQHLLVAKVEGDLDLAQNNRLNGLLSDQPSLQKNLATLYKTKLKSEAIVFEHKDMLKRKATRVIPISSVFIRFAAAAAVLILMVLIYNSQEPAVAHFASSYIQAPNSIVDVVAPPANTSVTSQELKNTSISDDQPEQSSGISQIKSEDNNAFVAPFSAPQQNIAFNNVEKIKTRTADKLDVAYHPDIVKKTPEMLPVLMTKTNYSAPDAPESTTVLAYLGKVAKESIENTYAYSFAERQLEKISHKAKEEIRVEKKESQNSQELFLKLGNFEMRKELEKKKTEKQGPFQKLEKLIDKVIR